ncbi:MAG: repeat-containing protein, partial [Methanobacterium sp. Maddingley MBC34]
SADIQVDKWVCNNSHSCAWVNPSSNYNYNDISYWLVKVTNKGPDNATGVQITDLLPSGLILTDYYIQMPGSDIWTQYDPSYNNSTGIWTIGNINVNQYAEFNFAALITKTGNLTNWANKTNQTEYD